MGSIGTAFAAGGCRYLGDDLETRLERPSFASPNYFCTWYSQDAAMLANGGKKDCGVPQFPGDQGGRTRDWMNEKLVFGENGYARQYPKLRSDLFLVLDDGWDVPYGAPVGPRGDRSFGLMCPDPQRFPSFKGTPGQRIRGISDRVRDLGWRGLGLWVSPKSHCNFKDHQDEYAQFAGLTQREDWKRKLEWCAEGGVGYLKCDWGWECAKPWYRAMMTEVKNEIAPHIVIEHCFCQPPFNGIGPEGLLRGTRRLAGEHDAHVREFERKVLPHCDTWRTYDVYEPFTCSQTIERAVTDLSLAEETKSRAIVSTEDSLYLGSTLGCAFGIMRSPIGRPSTGKEYSFYNRLDEVTRAVRWSRLAPAFPVTPGFEVRWSEETLAEKGVVDPKFWFPTLAGQEYVQEAPAVVARGLPLPEVKCSGEAPYVLCSRNPNGAVSVGASPRYMPDGSWPTHRADVTVDHRMRWGEPLGVFGHFGSLTIGAARDARVMARDLAGGAEHDVTAECSFANGRWTLPGAMLSRVGGELTTDRSLPAALVRFI